MQVRVHIEGQRIFPVIEDEPEQFPFARCEIRVIHHRVGRCDCRASGCVRHGLCLCPADVLSCRSVIVRPGSCVLRIACPVLPVTAFPLLPFPLLGEHVASCAPYPFEQYLGFYIESGAAGLDIYGTFHCIRYHRDGVRYVIDQVGLLQGVVAGFPEQQVGLEAYEVLLVLRNEVADLVQGMFPGEGIRVIPVREQHHLDIEPFFQHKPDTSQRGMDSGRVTVIDDGHVFGEFPDKPYLFDSQRCPARSHHVGYSELVHRYHIEIPLDQQAFVLPRNLVLGEIYPVQGAAFYIDFGFR